MKFKSLPESRPNRRGSRAQDVIRPVDPKDEDTFNEWELVEGKDRAYLEQLIKKPAPSDPELSVLAKSVWIASIDERYRDSLAQVPDLEEYLWSEVEKFRDMYLAPFGESKKLSELEPDGVLQVAVAYMDAIRLLEIFPESKHKKEISGWLRQEERTFISLLDSPEVPVYYKLGICVTLIMLMPEKKTRLLHKISLEEVRQAIEQKPNVDLLFLALLLFPQIRAENHPAIESAQSQLEEVLNEGRKVRMQNPGNFSRYLDNLFPYTMLVAEESSLDSQGKLDIRLKPKALNAKNPSLPERLAV